MKKLIALIGAVATCFGLYATDPVPFATSFESRDAGISTTEAGATIFTPGEGWDNNTDEETFPVKAYEAGEVLPYESGTAMKRRDDSFTDTDNFNYLKLSTGTNALMRTVGEGNKFLDQLVKFTGFEEPQTNLVDGVKIAVWMSEYVIDETADVETTETNLYVTCAKVVGTQVEQVALKIAPPEGKEYKLDTWYRLTIKTLDSIYGEDPTDAPRAGFIVYIDGQQIAAESDDAQSLISYAAEMTPTARGFMAKKMLFPAISATDATFAKIGFEGMGAVDDIIIDNEGPEFAQTIPFTVTPGTGLEVVSIVDEDGAVVDPTVGVLSGRKVFVTFGPLAGYKVMSGSLIVEATIDGAEIDIKSDGITTAEVVAEVVNASDLTTTNLFAESELYGMITGFVNGDTATFVKGGDITNMVADAESGESVAVTYYSVTEGTTITVTDNEGAITWDVYVADYLVEEIPTAGSFTDYVGVDAGNTMNVEFEDGDNGMLMLYAESIAGALNVENGQFEIYSPVTVSGTITSAVLSLYDVITLSGSGKVITTDGRFVDSGFIVGADGAKVDVLEDTPTTGWFTYQLAGGVTFTISTDTNVEQIKVEDDEGNEIKADGDGKYTAAPDADLTITLTAKEGYFFDNTQDKNTKVVETTTAAIVDDVLDLSDEAPTKAGFMILIADETTYYLDAATALAAVKVAEAADNYPIVVTAKTDVTIPGPDEQTLTLAEDGTITITANAWAITGTVSGSVVLAPGKQITIPLASKDNVVVTTAEGYKLQPMATNDTITYESVVKPMIAKNLTTDVEYADLAEAITAAADGDTIQLIADGEVEVAGTYARVANKAITIDLNGHTINVAMPTHSGGSSFIAVASTGSLTMKDTSDGEVGKIVTASADADGWVSGYQILYNEGILTIEGGTYDMGTLHSLSYCVVNRCSTSGTAVVNIKGGLVKSTYVGVNEYTYATAEMDERAILNVSGGTIYGKYGIYFNRGGGDVDYSQINITDGTVSGMNAAICIYTPAAVEEAFVLNVSGGTLSCDSTSTYGVIYAYWIGGEYININVTGGNFVGNGKPIFYNDPNYAPAEYFAYYDAKFIGGTYDEENVASVDNLGLIPVYAKVDKQTDAELWDINLIPVALNIAAGTGVSAFTYTVNGAPSVDGQLVKFGDVIKITDVTYAAGYSEGTIKKDTEITVGEDRLVDETGALVAAVAITIDAVKYAAKKGLLFFITLQDAVNSDEPGDIELLDNITLDKVVEVTKPVAINLAKKTVTVAGEAEGAFWFETGSDGFVLSNGTIKAEFAAFNADAYLVQFCITDKDTVLKGTVKDVTVNAENCAGGVVGVTDSWDLDPAVNTLITCENVAVTGGRYLFYFENPNARLVNCTATQANGLDSQVWKNCAVGAAWGSTVTVESGTYTAEDYALITMSSPATFVVNGGKFTGDVEDWKLDYEGEHVWEISGGDFSDKEIPTDFIKKTTDTQIAKWVDSETYEDYVTPATVEAVATVNGELYETAADALLAVQAAEAAGQFPISVVALQDNVVVQGPDGQSITLAKNGAITIKADSWAFTPAPTITKIVLAEGKKIVVPTQIENYKTVILCAVGYKVVENAIDGGYEYTVEALPNVAKINDIEYKTLQEAFAAAVDGDTIVMIANADIGEFSNVGLLVKGEITGTGVLVSKKSITLDLAGKNITGQMASQSGALIKVAYSGEFTLTNSTDVVGVIDCTMKSGVTPNNNTCVIENRGTFNMEGGKVFSSIANGMYGYTIINYNNQSYDGDVAIFNLRGGEVDMENGDQAIRLYCNWTVAAGGAAHPNVFNMTGGTILRGGIWLQHSSAADFACEVNISGGTINGFCDFAGSESTTVNISGDATINATTLRLRGTKFSIHEKPYLFVKGGNWKIDAWDDQQLDNPAMEITGGTFTNVAATDDKTKSFVPAFVCEINDATPEDGKYTVTKVPVPLTVAGGEGVTAVAYTVNGVAPVAGQEVVYGDTIEIGEVTYAAGYEAGEIAEGDVIDVTYEMMVTGDPAALVEAVVVTVDAAALPVAFSYTDNSGDNATAVLKIGGEVPAEIPTELAVGTTYAVTSTANEGYTYKGVVAAGWTVDPSNEKVITLSGTAAVNTPISIEVPAPVAGQTDPIPPVEPKSDEEVAELVKDLADKTVGDIVKTPAEYTAFQIWAHSVPGSSAAVAESTKAAVSFQLSPIVNSPTLFTNEPAVKFTAIAQSGTSWNATMELKDGDTAVQLKAAKDAYAQFVKVGTVVTNITTPATITGAINADETKIVLTITPPTGDAGFIKFTTAK